MLNHEFAGDGAVSGDADVDGITVNDSGLIDAVDLPIIVISRDCKIARINRAATTVLGLKQTDIGSALVDSLPRVEDLSRLCARAIADGAPHRIETRDGDRRFLLRIAPYREGDRQTLGAVLTFTNISAFRASIDQAIYEREYTKAILNAVIDPLVVLDNKLKVQTANRAFYSLFGVSRDEVQGISIRELGSNDWESSDSWNAIETALSDRTEFRAIEIEGEFPVVGRRTFVLDVRRLAPDGDALILTTFQDITERKQAQRTTSLLAAIVDHSDDAIISKKLDGTLTSWNKSAERLFGYKAEEAIGQHITLIVPPDRRSEEESILRRLALGERVDHFETIRRRKDGTDLDVSLTISPIRDAAGSVIGASKVARDITERKRAERALSEQARLLDLSNDAIVIRDADDRVTYWNRAATELYGFTHQEALGRVTHELLQTQFPAPLEWINEQLHHDERWRGELVHIRKDGTKAIVNSRWVLDRKADGSSWCILETNNDITKQKRTEKALRESEERFRAIVETTPECVKLISADGTLLQMNSSGLQMLGATFADDLLGKSVYDLVVPEDRGRFRAFNEAVCRGQQGSLQFEIVGLEGKRRHMETHAAPLNTPDGTTVHLAVSSDITQRKQAEQALRESEQRYRVITEAAPIMVWMAGLDKLCYYFNKGWLDFVGHSLDQECGNGWTRGVHPDDFDRCLQVYESSFEACRSFEMQYRLKHHSGQYRWILDHGVPRFGPDGTFEGYVGGCLDIHNQKEAEEKARSVDVSLQLMSSQDEERRHIARELHDTAGQTLTVLGINLAQLVQNTARRAPELAGEAERIQETVQQLHREIRTTSYLLHPPLLDETGLQSAVSWYVQGLPERSGLEVRLDIPEDFGRLPSDMELVVFRLVQECLTNIHRHSESKTASIRMVRESNWVTLDIRDQGKGMSSTRLAEVQAGSSGLGIRGMRERLRQFDGSLNIESGDSGTRVFARIPVTKTESPGGTLNLGKQLSEPRERVPPSEAGD
jgi:PAS domain S-box-containing protein